MSKVIELRGKLGGIRKINKMTEAMQVVAVAQLKKVQARQRAAAHYRKAYDRMVKKLGIQLFPTAEKVKPIEMVYVIASDRGFCGSFNDNLLEKVLKYAGRNPASHFVVVGAKGCERAREMRLPRVDSLLTEKEVRGDSLAQQAEELFMGGAAAKVSIFYNEFKSMLYQVPAMYPVLPLSTAGDGEGVEEIIFEPSRQAVKDYVEANYLKVLFWDAVLQTRLGETAARLITMRGATDSSQEMMDNLQIKLNKARQAAITVELSEIVSSFEILNEE
jgi:F-type H+-transporting ATPase subunit gamma